MLCEAGLAAGAIDGPAVLEKSGRAGRQRAARRIPGMEFPDPSVEVLDEHSRRDFLRVHGGIAGPGGTERLCLPARPSRSYRTSRRPRRSYRGSRCFSPRRFPSMVMRCGVLVKSHMGRPINLEGNPAHPASLGAVDIFGQATILTLYDPGSFADGDPQRPWSIRGSTCRPSC